MSGLIVGLINFGGGSGTDLTGLGTDNRVARWDGTDTIQSSGWTLDDADALQAGGDLGMGTNSLNLGGSTPIKYIGSTMFTMTSGISPVNYFDFENAATTQPVKITAAGSDSNIDLHLLPKGTGNVTLGTMEFDSDQSIGLGQDNYVLTYDNATGLISLEAAAAGGISNVVEDTTPQLGGQLDVNGQAIGDGTRELLTFTEDVSAVNHINIENEATGSGPILSAAGDDANVDLNIQAKGTGNITLGNFTFDADQTVGAGQDNYVFTYDNGTGLVSLEAAAGGGLANVVEDTTPQLGGMLDVNGFAIGDGTLELLTFTETASAVNHVNITNAITNDYPQITAAGDDTNIPLFLSGKGSGELWLGGAVGYGNFNHLSITGNWSDSAARLGMSTTASGRTGTLPTAVAGKIVHCYDYTGSGGTNSFTISPNTGDVIVGVSSALEITSDYGNVFLKAINTTQWVIVGGTGYSIDGSPVGITGTGTDNRVPRYDGANTLQSSGWVLNDTDVLFNGGNLDTNGHNIIFNSLSSLQDDSSNNYLRFNKTTSAVNYIDLTNAATGNGPILAANGSDSNIDFQLNAKGTGEVIISDVEFSGGVAYQSTALTSGAGTKTMDGNTAADYTYEQSGASPTFAAPTNVVVGQRFSLEITDTTGSGTITWNAAFEWEGGTAPAALSAGETRQIDFRVAAVSGTTATRVSGFYSGAIS